jgi:hypothetical protein
MTVENADGLVKDLGPQPKDGEDRVGGSVGLDEVVLEGGDQAGGIHSRELSVAGLALDGGDHLDASQLGDEDWSGPTHSIRRLFVGVPLDNRRRVREDAQSRPSTT